MEVEMSKENGLSNHCPEASVTLMTETTSLISSLLNVALCLFATAAAQVHASWCFGCSTLLFLFPLSGDLQHSCYVHCKIRCET